MLRVKIMSDLHLDCHKDGGKSFIQGLNSYDHDVAIICGDIAEASDVDYYYDCMVQLASKLNTILFVSGNHEYWNSYSEAADLAIDEIAESFSNVVRLKPKRCETISGINFWGGTMWFPPTQNWEVYSKQFPDFTKIGDFNLWVFKQHQDFKDMFADGWIEKGDVIVSHHMPSYKCVQPRWANSPWNKFFVADMDNHIINREPSHWFFGHTHDNIDMNIGKTRLVCNPFGYPHENTKFVDNLIIEM